jgi:TolA-binding protein
MERVMAAHQLLEPPPASPFQRQRDLGLVERRLARPEGRFRALFAGIALAAGTCAAALLALAWPGGPTLEIVASAGDSTIAVGRVVAVGDWLATKPGARVSARWGATLVRIDEEPRTTRFRLAASSRREQRLQLGEGRLLFDVEPLAPGTLLSIDTSRARVTVHGTRFFVEETATATTVAVDRGLVRVEAGGRTLELPAGTRWSSLESGSARPLEADDARALVGLPPLPEPPGADELDAPEEELAVPDAEVRADDSKGPLTRPPRRKRAHRETSDVLAKARSLVLAGAYSKALAELEELRQRASSPTVIARGALLEAQVYRLKGAPERAVARLEGVARGRGLEAEQAQVLAAQILSSDLKAPGRAADAWRSYRQRFPSGVFRDEAAFRLGEALLAAGEVTGGLAALDRYFAAFPRGARIDDAHLLAAAARRDRLSDCQGALLHFDTIPRDHSRTRPLAVVGKARCLLSLGRPLEARSAYQEYLQLAPEGPYATEARRQVGAGTP